MKYQMDLNWAQSLEIDADSREEALVKAKETFPNHKVDYIISEADGNGSCVDYCECCDKPIFDDQEFAMDEDDGYMVCKECTPTGDALEEWLNEIKKEEDN